MYLVKTFGILVRNALQRYNLFGHINFLLERHLCVLRTQLNPGIYDEFMYSVIL